MKITVTQRLHELGYTLPPVPKPLAAYIPAMRQDNRVWTAGQLPLTETGLHVKGKVGAEVSLDQAVKASRLAVLNALSAAGSAAGGVDNIESIVKITVYVACAPDFYDHPKVANGASELLAMVFGSEGLHIRSAVGVVSLPMNAPLEIELIANVKTEEPDQDEAHEK